MADTNFPTPPYVPYQTFKTFIINLDQSGVVPTKIDRRVLSTFSGSAQAALIPGLKFLGLIDDEAATTERLKRLVAARAQGDDAWKQDLKELLSSCFGEIIGDLDLSSGTYGELVEAFRTRAGTSASVVTKNVRFYLQAMEDAGWTYSPHMKAKRSPSSSTGGNRQPRKRTRTPRRPETPTDGSAGAGTPGRERTGHGRLPEGFARQDIPTIEGAYIVYPVAMSESQFKLFEAALQFMRAVTQKGEQQ